MRFASPSLGFKLNVSLLLFFVILCGLTSAISVYGNSRTQDNATLKSREGLEEIGQREMLTVAKDQAGFGALQLQWASDAGQMAAKYFIDFKRSGASLPYDATRLVRNGRGVLYDPDPGRHADVVMPNFAALTEAAMQDAADSAALDAIAPSIFAPYPGRLREANFDAIAFYFASVNHVHRFFPPIGVADIANPATDATPRLNQLGPIQNPERKTVWTPPYEDNTGQGLVMTAYTPVYEGDVYRGVIGIDISVTRLVDQVNSIKLTEFGFSFYLDRSGVLMKSDAHDAISRELDAGNEAMTATLIAMRGGEKDVARVRVDGRDMFIAYAPISEVGGSFGVAAEISEITAQAAVIADSISEQGAQTFRITLLAMVGLFVAGLSGAAYLNRRVLLRPIEALVGGTRAVADGDFSASIPVAGEDELAVLARSFNDMTAEIGEARQDLERRVEERTRELKALLNVSGNLASTLELVPLLDLVIDELKGLADYSQCSIYILEDEALCVVASRSTSQVPAISERVSLSDLALSWPQMNEGRAIIINDMKANPEPTSGQGRSAAELFATADTRSWMGVPLTLKDRFIGMLSFSHTGLGFYEERNSSLVSAIASQVAVAMENARLYGQAQQLAALEERQRLARELHDSVSQALYGIALSASAAQTLLDADPPPPARQPVDYVMTLAQAAMAEMRALIFELRPESLEVEGLIAALNKQVAAMTARHGIAVEAELGEEPEIPLPVKEVLYRVCQEALHNVAKHSQATKAGVKLLHIAGELTLEISDNGIGFDSTQKFPGHIGLISMPERAATVGGRLVVLSAPGKGTTVRVSAPLATP